VILKYADREELRRLLVEALQGKAEETLERARGFVEQRSPRKIAKRYLRLFEELSPK
jgi:hypothetical protein